MASSTARGRGIGRGRGFGFPKAQTKPGESPVEQKNLPFENMAEEFNLSKVLSDLKDTNIEETVAKLLKYISSSDSSSKIKEVVNLLCQRSLKDSEFAPLAAKASSKLCSADSLGIAFRGCLLKSTQENYKNREIVRKKSIREWIGLSALLCELFNHLRTGEAPLKPLAGAVYQTLAELLMTEGGTARSEDEDLEEDEIDCFYQHFKTVGKLLEVVDAGKMDDLVGKIRDTILAVGTSAKTRCLLVELLELRAHDWTLSSAVEIYYCDTLADIMAQGV